MARTGGRRDRRPRQRPHKPDELGPRLFQRGRWFGVDLRPWGMGRVTMRDPGHPGWPDRGDRTELGEVAEKWRWSYYDLALNGVRNKQLGIKAVRTLGQARDEYQVHRERTVERQTQQSDRYAISFLVAAVGEDKPLDEITTADIQRAADRYLDAGYSRNTVQTIKVYLSGFFNWAEIDPNPARGVVLPRPTEKEIFAWSDAELARLRRAADEVDREDHDRQARLLLEVGLATGARFREILALRWEDFDPKMRTVRITRQLSQYSRATKAPKSRRGRTAVVLPFFWEFYREGAEGYVLNGRGGAPMASKPAELSLRRILETAELDGPQRAFHDLRRTYGRLFLEMGGWMDELQRSLGHRSIRTTERDYGKFQEDVAAQFAVDRLYGDGRARRLRVV